jgi:hypothetical protein
MKGEEIQSVEPNSRSDEVSIFAFNQSEEG